MDPAHARHLDRGEIVMTTAAPVASAAASINPAAHMAAISEQRAEMVWELHRRDRALDRILTACLTVIKSELVLLVYLLDKERATAFPNLATPEAKGGMIREASKSARTLESVLSLSQVSQADSLAVLAGKVLKATDAAYRATFDQRDPLPIIAAALGEVESFQDAL